MMIGQTLNGFARILAVRDFGSIIFADALFQEEQIQIVFEAAREKEFVHAAHAAVGDLFEVWGVVATTKTGQVSLFVSSIISVIKNRSALARQDVRTPATRFDRRHADLAFNQNSFEFWQRTSDLLTGSRNLLTKSGFREFNTGVLQQVRDAGLAGAFTTECVANRKTYSLSLTSEFKLKRLIAGGFTQVYEIAQSFRNEGMNRDHTPEFSLLEAYATETTIESLESLIEKTVKLVLPGEYRFPRVSFIEIWERFHGHSIVDLSTLCASHPELFKVGMQGFTWVYKFITKVLAPSIDEPTFVTGVPMQFSPLAESLTEDTRFMNGGILVAKGLHVATYSRDLNDYDQVKRVFETQNAESGIPINESYLDLLKFGLPPTVGVGLGINRLMMLDMGALPHDIRETSLYPLR